MFDVGLWNQFLKDAGLYESQEEAIRREEVLGRLDQVDSLVFIFYIFFKNLINFSCTYNIQYKWHYNFRL